MTCTEGRSADVRGCVVEATEYGHFDYPPALVDDTRGASGSAAGAAA